MLAAATDPTQRLVAAARSILPALPPVQRAILARALAARDAAAPLYDPDTREIVGARGRLRLTPQQGRVFAALAAAPGRLVRRAVLVEALVGDDADGGPDNAGQQLLVVVCRLRRSLRECGAPAEIGSVWGDGYRLDCEIGDAGGDRPRGRRVAGVSS